MRRLLARIASTRAAVALFALLAAVVVAAMLDARVPGWSAAVPLLLLAINLAAAMGMRPALRRGGLGLFHAALLACLALVAWGRLAHFEGRVEVGEGTAYDAMAVEPTSIGPWHGDGHQALRFEQLDFDVRYAPGVRRGATRSRVRVGERVLEVGDDRPIKIDGYRFYTTHNKGYAPVLRWTPAVGEPVTGALHLPSYPLNDWQQEQRWAPPGGGPSMRFWLRLDQPLAEDRAWTLAPTGQAARLVVAWNGRRHELRPGEAVRTPEGELRFERLGGWMGYRIHRDPAMEPLFWVALAGVLGLAWHLVPPARAQRAVHVPLDTRKELA